jgi:multicomponent Na+:H+ antiporter subunit B
MDRVPRRWRPRVEIFIDFALLALLGITALAVLRVTNLFAAVMLAGIYSLLSAGLFTVMDAVDVAFTEAAVGAGISTVLMLATLALVGSRVTTPQFRISELSAKVPPRRPLFPIFIVLFTGAVLVYGTLDMPAYGRPDNPVHLHVAPHYLQDSEHEIGVPNVVTSVLASYRGYDTMGETTVVFTAAVGVMILLSVLRRRDAFGEEAWGEEGMEDLEVGFVDAFGEEMEQGRHGQRRRGMRKKPGKKKSR